MFYIKNPLYVIIHILYSICILNAYITSCSHKLRPGSHLSVGLSLFPNRSDPSALSLQRHPIISIFLGLIPNLPVLMFIFELSIRPFRSDHIASMFSALYSQRSNSRQHHAIPCMSVSTTIYVILLPFRQGIGSNKLS